MREEVRVQGGFIVDVALYRGASVAAAVEIVVTHSVEPRKARLLKIPWVELEAEDVLERPYWWEAVRDRLRPFRCPTCRSRGDTVRAEKGELDRLGRELAASWGRRSDP